MKKILLVMITALLMVGFYPAAGRAGQVLASEKDTAKTETAKTETAKIKTAKTETSRTEASKTETSKQKSASRLPKKYVIEDVPHIYQVEKYPTGCESVSMVVAMQYAGCEITPDISEADGSQELMYQSQRLAYVKKKAKGKKKTEGQETGTKKTDSKKKGDGKKKSDGKT